MKQHLSLHRINETSRPRLEELFTRRAGKLAPLLEHFQPDLLHLEGRVEKNPNHQLYRLTLRLKLGNNVLVVAEEGHELGPVLDEAFDELERRCKKFVARLQRAHLWKRPSRRRRLREWLKQATDAREREQRALYFDLISAHLDSLYGFIHRELTYLENAGDLRPGILQTEELVDAAVLRGWEQFRQQPTRLDVRHWLLSLAVEVTVEAITALQAAQPGEVVSLHRRPSPEPAGIRDEDETWLEFWMPDERLRIEDLIPAPAQRSPEEDHAWFELQQQLHRTLAQLPRGWRQALVLIDMEGLDVAEAARVLKCDSAEIEALLGHARAFVQARLMDAGFSAEDLGGVPAEYIAPTPATPMPDTLREDIARALVQPEPAG